MTMPYEVPVEKQVRVGSKGSSAHFGTRSDSPRLAGGCSCTSHDPPGRFQIYWCFPDKSGEDAKVDK